MEGFAAIILICLMNTAPESCTEETAVAVRSIHVQSELECTTGWQDVAARASAEQGIGSETYVKTLCRRTLRANPGQAGQPRR